MAKVAPLKTSFMLTSMIGFLISILYIPQFSTNWAFAFGLIFVLMFISSLISMIHGAPDEQLYPRPRKID